MKCLLAAHAIDAENPDLHFQAHRIREFVLSPPKPAPPKLSELVSSAASILFASDKDPSDWNDEFLSRHKTSAAHVQSGLRVRALIAKRPREEIEADLISTLSFETISLERTTRGFDLLDEWGSPPEVKEKYRSTATGRWPLAQTFPNAHS